MCQGTSRKLQMAKNRTQRVQAQEPAPQADQPLPQGGEQAPQTPGEQPATTAQKIVAGEIALPALGTVFAAANVVARAGKAAFSKAPVGIASQLYVLGRPCKVRVPYTLACYEKVAAELAAGPASAEKLAQASTGDFVRYAVRNGWLAKAPQA